MSFDVTLNDPVTKEPIVLDHNHHMAGGTFCVGGTNELWLNVTYNYSPMYRRENTLGEEKGLRVLDGMPAVDAIPLLEKAISNLGDEVDANYWTATEGNAKRALVQILAMAKMRPDGVFEVT